jgi:hypothetical protein
MSMGNYAVIVVHRPIRNKRLRSKLCETVLNKSWPFDHFSMAEIGFSVKLHETVTSDNFGPGNYQAKHFI